MITRTIVPYLLFSILPLLTAWIQGDVFREIFGRDIVSSSIYQNDHLSGISNNIEGEIVYLPIVFNNFQSQTCGIENCDFEQGATIWYEYSEKGYPLIIETTQLPVPPHSGSWAAWLGGDDDEISYLAQNIYVPADRPYLTYWYWIDSEDLCGYDFALVIINSDEVYSHDLCYDNNSFTWEKNVIDLSAYANQTVELVVGVVTDEEYFSSLFLDDFSFVSTGYLP